MVDLVVDLGVSMIVFGVASVIGAPAIAASLVSIGISAVVSNLLDRAFA